MKKAKRIVLQELCQWIDYRDMLDRYRNSLIASGLPPKYLGKSITQKQIMEANDKIELLRKKINKM